MARGGNRPPMYRREIERVALQPPTHDCVLFTGKQQPNGYGRVSIDGHYRRAHVYACELAHGVKPRPELVVAHSCGERMCINPQHLRWATRAENEADKVLHGRANRGQPKLSLVEVRTIRHLVAVGASSQTQLARDLGVHLMTVNDVVHHRTWRHVA